MKYNPFVETYGLRFKATPVDMGLKYAAIENGSFDVSVVYATDGLNRKVGLKILEDDKSFFPDYNGAFLVRQDLLDQYPEVAEILNLLAGKIPTEQMAELTYQVDVMGRTVDEVAPGLPGPAGPAERLTMNPARSLMGRGGNDKKAP